MCTCLDCLDSLTAAQKNTLVNGCGGKAGSLRPIHWWGLEPDCDCHDLHYTEGGTPADRLAADQELRAAIMSNIAGNAWWKMPYYKLQAWTFYYAVRLFGAKYFSVRPVKLTCNEVVAMARGVP